MHCNLDESGGRATPNGAGLGPAVNYKTTVKGYAFVPCTFLSSFFDTLGPIFKRRQRTTFPTFLLKVFTLLADFSSFRRKQQQFSTREYLKSIRFDQIDARACNILLRKNIVFEGNCGKFSISVEDFIKRRPHPLCKWNT